MTTTFKTHPLRWTFGFFLSVILLAGSTYSLVEPSAGILDGVWWALVTAFTVGYGDFSPKSEFTRFFVGIPVMLTGIACVSVFTANLAASLVQFNAEHYNETPELHDDLDDAIRHLQLVHNELKRRETSAKT